jgi:HlyD family secretion protein
VSTNQAQTPSARAPGGNRWGRVLIVGAVLVGVGAYGLVTWLAEARTESKSVALFAVRRGPLVISVTESGTIKSREKVVLKSEVAGRTTILTLIPEGTHVKKGTLLVELDGSKLVDDRTKQQIVVLNAEASYIRARENLAVTTSQGESDVAKAALEYKFAKLDQKKYLEGEYPQDLQEADSEITLAKEELQRADEKLQWSQRLAKDGYLSQIEVKGDALTAKRAQLNLKLAQGKKWLLQSFTHQRNVQQHESDVDQTAKALDRVNRRAAADVIQAKAELKAKESEFKRQQAQLEKVNKQITKCRIVAPVDGMVVYATTGKGHWRGNVEPLDEGQDVRERQELIHLPTTSGMMAEVKVHESSLTKVRRGLPVRVTIDALPGRAFTGRVRKIGLLPDAQMAFLNPDLKVYSTQIDIEGDSAELRPGMTCRAEIIVDEYDDTLYVPVQSVLRVGGHSTAYVLGPDGPIARPIKVGLDNNRVIRVIEGLAEGEKVLVAPPLAPSEALESAPSPSAAGKPKPKTKAAPPGAAASQPAKAKPKPIDMSKLKNMSPEERRKWMQSLTPEQRQQLMKRFGGRGGRPGRGRRPGPPDGTNPR